MAKKFGTTWWGEQWLNSLQHIDYSNRLPRGATYARAGAVRSIDIKDGRIAARVEGSRPTPYKEVITVPQFDKRKTKAFVDLLTTHPLVLAALMQRRLDPEVLKIAKECGLQVFPSSWKDLGMECSCPDWAVPCKHLAAVIYKISEEIDNNPFLVFELHGLNLLDELKKRGLLTETASENLNPTHIDKFISTTKIVDANNNEWKESDPDFSKLPAIGDELLQLLADNPPFSISSDFKKIYIKQLNTISKSIAKTLNTAIDNDAPEVFEPGTEIGFRIDKTSYDTEVTLTPPTGKSIKISFTDFIERLAHITPAMYLTSQPWVKAMHKMWLLAANLLSHKDIVPAIVSAGKSYRILWQPAILHSEIRNIVKSVTDIVPAKAVVYGRENVLNAGEWLLCNMLNVMITQISSIQYFHEPLSDLFFLNEPQRFSGIGQNNIPGGIKVWTDRFFMLDERYKFSLWVDEKSTKFSVNLYIAISEQGNSIVKRIPFTDFMGNPTFATQQLEVMTKLTSLTDYMPELRNYITAQGTKPMKFDTRSLVPFLFKTLPLMRLLGVDVILPKSLRELVTPKVTVKIGRKSTSENKSYVRLDELLEFSWEVALGDEAISVEEFKDIMHHAGELVKFKGRYIFTTPEELERISKQLMKGERLTSQEMLAIALSESYKDAPVTLTTACRELLDRFRQSPTLPLPAGLQAELRPYQLRGYEWMMHNLSLGFGAIIADDMGLGKTLQVIAVLLRLKENGRLDKCKVLVVVPTGLLTNWQKECTRFAPALKVDIYHGPNRNLDTFEADVMLTSYGVMRSDVAKLKKLKWELLVIDEAQNIKNSTTAQAKAINSVPAIGHIAMSGTPVENRLSEYWSIMNFANKGLLGTLKEFNKKYGRPIQLEGNKEVAERFKATTSPFMLRRLKSDKSIISDLPDKTERDEYASLTPDQSALYQQTLNEAMREIEGITGKDHASLFKREGLVLQMIMALKQICNHPAQFLKTKQADANLSGKAMLLMDLVHGIVDSGEKVLIFTQFKEMGDLIVKMLDKIDIPSMFYHGGTTLKKRNEMVERFQNQRSAQVFVLSLKAAGTGLNLTAATNVIHFDLWWNPAVEAQATDRAYRIGQHRNVQVYRFITKGTFEEKINTMIQDKKRLADLTVGTGEKWLAEMSDSELRSIFTLESYT
ncbi:MAG: DEAD/DEAH box helicase family protein [Muribaculaceae bacterium]|nr:DEAD/DEAH box helicase family protein [Muribaculaceae bacterium]